MPVSLQYLYRYIQNFPYAGLVLHHLLQTARPYLAQHFSCVTLCFASCKINSRFEDFPLGICSPTEEYRLSSFLYDFVSSFLYFIPSISRSLEHSKNIITPCWLRLNLGSLQMRHFWSVFAQIFGDLRNTNPSEAKNTIKWSAGVVVITIPLHYYVDRNRSRVRSPR
jgi:hypothetical protein